MLKVIKTDIDYENALEALGSLLEKNPPIDSHESDELEVLSLLIETYEKKHYSIEKPNAIEAIKFRMEQGGLSQRDLIPFIGSRSKVSEILSGKRSLTVNMIKALHEGLGIPAEVLINEPKGRKLDFSKFPFREMIKRGWIRSTLSNASNYEKIIQDWLPKSISREYLPQFLYRISDHIRSGKDFDEYALAAWTAQIINKAISDPPQTHCLLREVNKEFIREVVKLSVEANGPLKAKKYLEKHGIALILEKHLPKTFLDGAAILWDDIPIIGMTIRYDRLDNFWFTLSHELAHVALHLKESKLSFFDDLDVENPDDDYEKEADHLAQEALIPLEEWEKSPASKLRSPDAAIHLARKLEIHPAIVAGRMRYEFKTYRLLNNLVGNKEVRKHFPDVNWGG